MTDIKLTEIFTASRKQNREKYKDLEVQKRGNLRAGSSGILNAQGQSAGHCIRKAHLRQLGIELEEPSEDKLIMFDLGYANEDVIHKKLLNSLPPEYVVLREEEIPIEYTTSNGTKVTGRPDMVICKPLITTFVTQDDQYVHGSTNLPILGIELKSVHSVWTAREVLFGGKPKLANMIQAAHYMWKLNVPYKLVYTSYSQLGQGMAGQAWMAKMFPKMGEPLSEYVEYNKEKGTIKHIRQFEIVYDLMLDKHGRVLYKAEESEDWIPSIVTTGDIARFFDKVSMIQETGDLGPRPTALDTLGNKANYSDCDYCPMNNVCDKQDKSRSGYTAWLEDVRKARLLD